MKKILKVKGMHCPSCEVLLGDEFNDIGVKSKIDHKKGTAEVDFDEKKVSLEHIKKVIEKEGYKVEA